MEGEGRRVCHATDRLRSGDPLLHAGPGRLPHRGRPATRLLHGKPAAKRHGAPPCLNSAGRRGGNAMPRTYRDIAIEQMLRTVEEAMSQAMCLRSQLLGAQQIFLIAMKKGKVLPPVKFWPIRLGTRHSQPR